MQARKLAQLAKSPFAAFYTPCLGNTKIHIFKHGEYQYTLSVGIDILRSMTPRGAKNLWCSFWLTKTLPGGQPLNFFDSGICNSRKEAEAAADEELYRIVEELGNDS